MCYVLREYSFHQDEYLFITKSNKFLRGANVIRQFSSEKIVKRKNKVTPFYKAVFGHQSLFTSLYFLDFPHSSPQQKFTNPNFNPKSKP